MKKQDSPILEKDKISKSFLKAFSNIIRDIIGKKDLNFILGSILNNLAHFMGATHGCLFLLDPTQEYYDIRIGIGEFKKMIGMKCTSEMGIAKKILDSSKTAIIRSHCKWDSKNNRIIHIKKGMMIGIPIKTSENILGLFILSFPEYIGKLKIKEQKYMDIFSSLAMIALDNARLFNFIHDEYSELIKIEKSLRYSEDKFSKLFNLSPSLMTVISIQDKTLFDINENMLKVLKFKKSEIIGKKLEDFVSLKPELKSKIIELVENRKIVKNIDVNIIAKDGEERVGFLSNQIFNINDNDYMVFLVNDVTEVNILKEELEKSKSLESLAILSGGIAHNFNNLMQSLLGNISLAKYYLKPDDKVYKILTRAEKSYTRTKNLTDQLITFSEGGFFEKNIFNVRQFIKKLIEGLVIPDIVKINIDIHESVQNIEGDEGQLYHCFKNIFLNSIEAIKLDGLIEVKITSKNLKTNDSSAAPTAQYIEFLIKDNGEGIKKEDLRKILTPFYSSKGITHEGLGLAISYSIINRHNGKIRIESQQGIGTSVKILIPCKS
jgi:PAS domain S-box-containing protein